MKALLKIAKIVCYVCSFPLFMVFAILASMHNVEKGGSYGLLTYASIIVAVLFSVIWAIVVLVQELKLSKKDVKNKAKKIRKQTACQVVVSLMLCSGLMFVLDGVLPMIFGDLTSGTIFYEDVAESDAANNRATLNKDMLDAVIARSVLNGIIGENEDGNTQYFSYYKQSEHDNSGNYTGAYTGRVLDKDGNALVLCKYGFYVKDTVGSNDSSYKDFDKEYCRTNMAEPAVKSDEEIATMVEYFQKKIKKYTDMGYSSEEVKSLVARDGKYNMYDSLNLSGYESWVGPWVDLANDSRMTIPVVLNLVLGQRPSVVTGDQKGGPKNNPDETRVMQPNLHLYPWYNPTTCKVEMIEVGWTVLDMMGDGYTYNPDKIDGTNVTLPVDLSGTLGEGGLFAMISGINIGSANGLNVGELLKTLGLGNCLTETSSLLGVLEIPPVYYLLDSILNSVAYAVGNPNVAGTPGFEEKMVISDGTNESTVTVTSKAVQLEKFYDLSTDEGKNEYNAALQRASDAFVGTWVVGTNTYEFNGKGKVIFNGNVSNPYDYVVNGNTATINTGSVSWTCTLDENNKNSAVVDNANTGVSGWRYGFAPLFLKLVNADGSVVGTTNGSYYGNVGDKPTQLGVYSQNYSRGTIDYMRYSWVDANGLLFAITGLFAIRQTCYIFSGVTVILAILIGAIRMKEYRLDNPGTDGKKHDGENTDTPVTEDAAADTNDAATDATDTATESYEVPYSGMTYEVPTYDVYNQQ